jgi:ribose/xylose/arabinose/galactoside ABC-type transport system permease subunit
VRLGVESGLLAIALTPVVITGGIDLSSGALLGLAAVTWARSGAMPAGRLRLRRAGRSRWARQAAR